jgi:hypothetical protein
MLCILCILSLVCKYRLKSGRWRWGKWACNSWILLSVRCAPCQVVVSLKSVQKAHLSLTALDIAWGAMLTPHCLAFLEGLDRCHRLRVRVFVASAAIATSSSSSSSSAAAAAAAVARMRW